MKKLILLPLFCCFIALVTAQDTVQLTNNFKFEDGVYVSITDLQANKPTYNWERIQASAHINKDKYIIQLEYLNLLDSNENLIRNLVNEDIWGICVEGVPYIRVADTMKQHIEFVGLRTRGQFCYFYYESFEMREVPMTIYDPETGNALWVQNITNKETINVQKMLNFTTGSVASLDLNIFKKWIKNDMQLMNTLDGLTAKEAEEKLYRMLLIYNDRNPYFMVK